MTSGMEISEKMKMKAVLAIVCFGAISVFFAAFYRRRLKEEERNAGNDCCFSDLENKPQNSFKRVLADNSYTPFKHLKREEGEDEKSTNLHPYEHEITFLLEHPPPLNFVIRNKHSDMGGSYIWVSTNSQLEELADILSKEQVFAVDTEQHSARSFLGFTALMQISTVKEDYLLDTIALHDVMGILRPVFANPSICKVFHGSDNDVLWLERDFHIYVVNLFDTAKREDWRLRPLSVQMVHYARSDAHYLLYIANCLVEELKKKGIENSVCPNDKLSFVLEASRRSNMVSLQLYAKDSEASPGDSAAASIISRYLHVQGGTWKSCETTELVRKMCTWRDLMARIHDESLRFVLSDPAIAALAMIVPRTTKEIYDTILQADLGVDSSCVGPSLPSPSPIACSHLEDLFNLLQEDTGDSDEFFRRIIQKHLGPNGMCQLSAYNYALLSKLSLKLTNRLVSKQNGGKPTKQASRKASRELFVQKFSCKSPVYHNCRIYASDGRLLCYCDRRKLEWYLRRDLAKLVEEDPPAIMLLFEPKGRPEDEDNDFYIQSKKNMCVGCGEGNHYLRYRIIPSCYRLHFPEHLKSHRSHDIVLLCVDCHEIAHSAAEKYKKQIAAEFDIPLFIQKVVDQGECRIPETSGFTGNHEEAGVSPLQLRTAAMALLRHGSRLPSKRREELILIVRSYFGGREVSDEDLETALLVGMSPQERRRLEKKRGLHIKHHEGDNLSKNSHENNIDRESMSAIAETSKMSRLCIFKEPDCSKPEDKDLPKGMDACARDTSTCSDLGEDSLTGVEENFDKIKTSGNRHVRLLDADHDKFGSRKLPNGTSESSPSRSNGTASSKYGPKLSLLGHGPHGKQVVEHLLKEYGEDGIRQFCQRWRQVFVEAIHPRFLPSGWDVMHSGRRDFGEYSVYNPSKRASNTIQVEQKFSPSGRVYECSNDENLIIPCHALT
ncbi:protein RRP6-like 3 isoform X2 [Magnolia sinica]|uniref:protein RRP6-like 3 isoform X2 n=1 Tax=Magnolia sinica TaxID=86752 RepID=UPI0026581009|nr:protein RRP6-like 3 isoform X2 [Magnolia sinica]